MKYAANPNDPYIDPSSGILRNRLGITNAKELERLEADFAALASYKLDREPPSGKFDLPHLQLIHQRLFGDVYAWAGELRQVDITKGSTRFAYAEKIEYAGNKLFEQLADEKYLVGLNAEAFSDRAGFYLGEINVLHPFREGNGRAQREFIGQLAHEAGYHINWSAMSRDAVMQASILAYHSTHTALATIIRDNLTERPATQSLEVSHALKRAELYDNLIIRDATVLKRDYKGEIVEITEQHALLKISDLLVVRYEKNQLDRDVQIGEKLTIQYTDQKSLVYEQGKEPACVQEQRLGRDRGR